MTNGRHSGMKWCEIVRVDSSIFLINSRQQACHYDWNGAEPLAVWYYLALWPVRMCHSYYGRELLYLGPFVTKITMRFLRLSALALGIADSEVEGADTTVPSFFRNRCQYTFAMRRCDEYLDTSNVVEGIRPLPLCHVHQQQVQSR